MSGKYRNEWVFGKAGKTILDSKESMFRQMLFQMLGKSTKMFEYKGLPDTIKHKDLETQLQVNGFCIWKEVKGNLYTFTGGLGGEPNPYYLPTIAIVANPALRYNAELKIDEECVVMLNDFYYQGLMPLFNKYGWLLVEAETSLKYAIWNARIPAIASASDDNTHASLKEYFEKVIEGKEYGVVLTDEIIDNLGVHTEAFYAQPYIKDLIEAIQYIKGSWYNELGLQAQFNMKREAINESEAAMNDDILFPTVEEMLQCRREGLEKVNNMFGTNITVELAGVWANNKEQAELSTDIMENEAKEDDNNEDKGNDNSTTESADV